MRELIPKYYIYPMYTYQSTISKNISSLSLFFINYRLEISFTPVHVFVSLSLQAFFFFFSDQWSVYFEKKEKEKEEENKIYFTFFLIIFLIFSFISKIKLHINYYLFKTNFFSRLIILLHRDYLLRKYLELYSRQRESRLKIIIKEAVHVN